MSKMNVAILVKPVSLEYDDRIRKEVDTLSKAYPNVTFKAFILLDDNSSTEGVTSYGLPYKSIHLKSRETRYRGRFLALKVFEYYFAIKNDLKNYDVVWVSGDDTSPLLLLLSKHRHKLVWDLRELPIYLLNSNIKKNILKYFFKKCILLPHANQYRIDYLKSLGLIKDPSKHVAIQNFPEFENPEVVLDDSYNKVKNWIGNRTCVYLQGLSNDSRASKESLSAVMDTPSICAIVLGGYDKSLPEYLNKKYGREEVQRRVYFAGSFNVLRIPQFMDLCKLSLVFYKNTQANNWFCEPNRLYQAINVGLPVIVGNNPSMRDIVECYHVGVSVDTDGSDVERIKSGIKQVIENYDYYKNNVDSNKDIFLWNNQKDKIIDSFRIVFK